MRIQDLPPLFTESFLVCRQAELPVLTSPLGLYFSEHCSTCHGEERVSGNVTAGPECTKSRDGH